MTTVNTSWSDEVFRAKVIRLGRLIRDIGGVNGNKHLQRILCRLWWQRFNRIG
jgi:hypothetical protein